MYGVSVEIVLKWGKVCWDGERCGVAHALFYTLFTPLPSPSTLTRHLFLHSPNTFPPDPLTHLTCLSNFPTFTSHLSTLSHYSPLPSHLSSLYLTPSLHLPQHFLTLTPHTSSQPPRLHQHFPILYHLPPYQSFSLFSFIAKLV